jgi:hypothetical protein
VPRNGSISISTCWTAAASSVKLIYRLLRKSPAVLVNSLSDDFTILLDDPNYRQFCKGEMQLAQLERTQQLELAQFEQRQKRRRDEQIENLEQLRSKFKKESSE